MSRRGRSGPAISLFAFQDIITSVTAIILVVVLFLVLDLLQRKQSTLQTLTKTVREDLSARITELDAEIATLRKETHQTGALMAEVAEFSPSELQAEIADLERALLDLQTQQRSQDQRYQIGSARLKTAIAGEFDLRPRQQELAETKRALRNLKAQLEATRQDPRTIFALPKGLNKQGWIAVIEADVISVAPLGKPAKPLEFRRSGFQFLSHSASDAMMSWIKSQHLEAAYFLLLVRPGGAAAFDSVHSALTARSIAHGFDVINATRPILHPEQGAAH